MAREVQRACGAYATYAPSPWIAWGCFDPPRETHRPPPGWHGRCFRSRVGGSTMRAAAASLDREQAPADEARVTTLLALVRAVGEVTRDDREVVATILHMLRSGEVRLCGNFRNTPIEDFE